VRREAHLQYGYPLTWGKKENLLEKIGPFSDVKYKLIIIYSTTN